MYYYYYILVVNTNICVTLNSHNQLMRYERGQIMTTKLNDYEFGISSEKIESLLEVSTKLNQSASIVSNASPDPRTCAECNFGCTGACVGTCTWSCDQSCVETCYTACAVNCSPRCINFTPPGQNN